MYLNHGSLWIGGRAPGGSPFCSAGEEGEFYPQLSQSRIDSFLERGWDDFSSEQYTILVSSAELTSNFDTSYCLWFDSDLFGQKDIDDDGDGLIDEDPLDYTDNDGDGFINEDFACFSDEDTYAIYNDLWNGPQASDHIPLGVEIIERTYAWSDQYRQNFILWDFEIINVGISSEASNENSLLVEADMLRDLTDVYAGIRLDGDLSSYAPGTYWYDDMVGYNQEYNISYMYDGNDPERAGDDTGESGIAAGYLFAALVNSPMSKTGVEDAPASHIYWTIDNAIVDDETKYQRLSSGSYAGLTPRPYDYRFLQSAGPYDMAPGDRLRLVWAMGVGDDLQDIVSGVTTARGVIARTQDALRPITYQLYPCYPNPFNPTTIIRYDLPRPVEVQLVVYDLLGRDIVRLVDQPMGAGAHRAVWNGRDAVGRLLPSGIYLTRMVTPGYTKSVKMVLLK